VAERETLWGWDVDDPPAELDDGQETNGHHEPITEPIAVVETFHTNHEVLSDADDGATSDTGEIGKVFTYAGPFIDRRPGSPATTLTFKPAPRPWYRTKPALIVLLAVVAVAIVLSIIPLVLRAPAPGSEEPTNVTPTSAEPAPSSAPPPSNSIRPTLTSAPAPPPPPPPPPPPAEDGGPVYTRQYPAPRGGSPSTPAKPDIDVTRAPISVAPEPRTPPTSARVGNGQNSGGFF
jgi:hypothetical protein